MSSIQRGRTTEAPAAALPLNEIQQTVQNDPALGWKKRTLRKGPEIYKTLALDGPLREVVSINSAGTHSLGVPYEVKWPIPSSERIKFPITLDDLEDGSEIGSTIAGVIVLKVSVKLNESTSFIAAKKIYGADSLKKATYELDALRALKNSHPNVVKTFNIFFIPDQLIVLMEYVNKGSLADLIRLSGPMPANTVAFIIRQVTLALQFLHQRKVVHRNVKPSNVLIHMDKSNCGRLKLGDFAISKETGGASSSSKDTLWIGSDHYRPPESVSDKALSRLPACDVWQIGVLGGHCAFGCFPLLSQAELDLAHIHIATVETLEKLEGCCANPFDFSCRLKAGETKILYTELNAAVAPRNRGERADITPALQKFLEKCLKIDHTQRPCCDALLQDALVDIHSIHMDDESSFGSWLIRTDYPNKFQAIKDAKKRPKNPAPAAPVASGSGHGKLL